MVVTISKRAPWNLGKQMLQIFPEPCEKCGLEALNQFSWVRLNRKEYIYRKLANSG
ncbi:MAG: hypothetical protein AAF443_04565 [Chlamydiota bacterium]